MTADGESEPITGSIDGVNHCRVEVAAWIGKTVRGDGQPFAKEGARIDRLLHDPTASFVRQKGVCLRVRADGHSSITHLREHLPAQRLKE